jgi:hypothetical protein
MDTTHFLFFVTFRSGDAATGSPPDGRLGRFFEAKAMKRGEEETMRRKKSFGPEYALASK